jgi:endo-1,4-beta-xylanase
VAIALHYKAVPEQFRYGITFWGLNDANSWIPEYYGKEDYPLLFDKNYAPKPMYCQLKENL